MTDDTWLVVVGSYHFGPFTHDEAAAFADESRGRAWPLWRPNETDAISNKPVLDLAYVERSSQ